MPNQEGSVIISYWVEQLGNLADVWTDNKLVLFLSDMSIVVWALVSHIADKQSENSKAIRQIINIRKSTLSVIFAK